MVEKYPNVLSSRNQLLALLRDLYTKEKGETNLALIIYDSGIVSTIAGLKKIDSRQMKMFTIWKIVLNEGLKTIYLCAFLNCKNLKKVFISSTVSKIQGDIFCGHDYKDLVLYCYPNTYGYEYAVKHGYKTENANNF